MSRLAHKEDGVGLVILAAGASRRLGQPKQLLQIDGTSLLARCIALSCCILPGHVHLVTGACRASVVRIMGRYSVNEIYNARWQQGMGSSIACSVAELSHQYDALLFMACDQYKLEASDLHNLIACWREGKKPVAAARYPHGAGIPAIFASCWFHRLGCLSEDRGARALLQRYAHQVTTVVMDNALADLDTPAQLAALQVN